MGRTSDDRITVTGVLLHFVKFWYLPRCDCPEATIRNWELDVQNTLYGYFAIKPAFYGPEDLMEVVEVLLDFARIWCLPRHDCPASTIWNLWELDVQNTTKWFSANKASVFRVLKVRQPLLHAPNCTELGSCVYAHQGPSGSRLWPMDIIDERITWR